jgi:hypothetical protein
VKKSLRDAPKKFWECEVLSQIDPNFLKFQNDLKKTAFGVKFARALLTGGNQALSQKFLREGFKTLGLEIPESVEITLDAAQMIVSGSATIDAVQAYESFDDIRSITRPGAVTLSSAMQIFEALGWMEKDSQEAQMIRTAINVAGIVGSFGLDVKSWIALALDVTGFEAKNQMNAKRIAMQGLQSTLSARIAPQATAAAMVLKDFQEKKMSAFAFVGKMAEAAPDLWPQYFPQFNSWAPVYDQTIYVRGESRTWYGSSSSHTAAHTFRTMAGWTPEQIKQFVFTNLAEPVLFPFFIANEFYENQGKASLKTLGVMGALGLLGRVSTGTNVETLLRNQVTLSDFFDPVVLKYLRNMSPPKQATRSAAVIVGGGVEVRTEKQIFEDRKRVFTWENREILEAAELAGRIDIVWQSPELRELLKESLAYPVIEPKKAYQEWNEGKIKSYGRGGNEAEVLSLAGGGYGVAWRDPRNYFAALAMISELRKDEYFKDWDAGEPTRFLAGGKVVGLSGRDLTDYDFLADIDEVDAMVREISFKMTLRKVNTLALGNVAYFLETTPEKLLRVNRGLDEPSVFDKKG